MTLQIREFRHAYLSLHALVADALLVWHILYSNAPACSCNSVHTFMCPCILLVRTRAWRLFGFTVVVTCPDAVPAMPVVTCHLPPDVAPVVSTPCVCWHWNTTRTSAPGSLLHMPATHTEELPPKITTSPLPPLVHTLGLQWDVSIALLCHGGIARSHTADLSPGHHRRNRHSSQAWRSSNGTGWTAAASSATPRSTPCPLHA